MRISDWSSDVCSSDLLSPFHGWDIPLLSVDGWWWLFAKVGFFASCFVWFRATFPRYRYDQIMRLGWKVFIPLSIAWIAVTALMAYYGVFEARSEEHASELQSLMRISYAVFFYTQKKEKS